MDQQFHEEDKDDLYNNTADLKEHENKNKDDLESREIDLTNGAFIFDINTRTIVNTQLGCKLGFLV